MHIIACDSLLYLGTWQTYVVKEQNVWHQINKSSPLEYAATITVNPLTSLRMLENFVDLHPGTIRFVQKMFFQSLFWQFSHLFHKIGDAVVQNGATSIVGQCVIQLAQVRGIKTINIIRDRCNFDGSKFSKCTLSFDWLISHICMPL